MTRVLLVSLLASASLSALASAAGPAAGVDPRAGGFEVGLGEWAIALEATAIRPGPVTVVVTNRGRYVHGFRVRSVRADGRGRGGDRFEARTLYLRSRQTARLTLDLPAGLYEIDCFVEGHDDLGMEASFEVRDDAPLVQPAQRQARGRSVRIATFRYAPTALRVPAGATVRWTNDDAAPHTVTAAGGGFSSSQLRKGQSFTRRFPRAGRYTYLCALHPSMRGTVVVTRR